MKMTSIVQGFSELMHGIQFLTEKKPVVNSFNRTGSSDRSFIGGLAHESAVDRGTKSLIAL